MSKSKLTFGGNVYGAGVRRQGKHDGSVPVGVSVDNSSGQSTPVGCEENSPTSRVSTRLAGVQSD
jgi:hypothetical protein